VGDELAATRKSFKYAKAHRPAVAIASTPFKA
jgi:hypothetical protein